MNEVLLITDDVPRGERLARDLSRFCTCCVLDLYGGVSSAPSAGMIVSDISTLTSDAILRLQRVLTEAKRGSLPHLFLVHGNSARAEAQARHLGATRTLPAGTVTQTLLAALEDLRSHKDQIAPLAERHAERARRFLIDVFNPGRPFTPAMIDTGAGLIAQAVRDAGVRGWVRAVQRFDDVTHQHCLLVAGLAAAFAQGLGLAAADRHRLTKAALLHDVGKIHVPTEILNKSGPLTEAEKTVMRTHPVNGYVMLTGRGFEDEMLAVVRSHHEMLDGSGYPDGLKEVQVPDFVRLVTICDIYAALIEHRPYKPPMSSGQAFGILDSMTGRLDDDLVRAFRPIGTAFDPALTKEIDPRLQDRG